MGQNLKENYFHVHQIAVSNTKSREESIDIKTFYDKSLETGYFLTKVKKTAF